MYFYEGNQYRIDEFGIKGNYQGKGFWKEFMNLLFKEGKEYNIDFLILTTNRNYPAFSFCKNIGFVLNEDDVMLYKKLK